MSLDAAAQVSPTSTSSPTVSLAPHKSLLVNQVHEMAEFFGYETRNKYQISGENNQPVAFAAEQQKGFLGFLMRQFLGHWRKYDILFFDTSRQPMMKAHHPFRFYFQRLEVYDNDGRMIGALQQRFSLLSKRFDVQNDKGMTIMEVSSPIWKVWTFPFKHNGQQIAQVAKKWAGFLSEAFTDKDKFLVEFQDPALKENERRLVLAAALFIDLQYFEKKAK